MRPLKSRGPYRRRNAASSNARAHNLLKTQGEKGRGERAQKTLSRRGNVGGFRGRQTLAAALEIASAMSASV